MGIYYNNPMVFNIVVPGAEFSCVCLFSMGQEEALANSVAFQGITAFLTCILAFKMFVNVHQWIGAIERLNDIDAKRRDDFDKED